MPYTVERYIIKLYLNILLNREMNRGVKSLG